MLSGTQDKPLSRQVEHQTALHSTQALPTDPGRNRGSCRYAYTPSPNGKEGDPTTIQDGRRVAKCNPDPGHMEEPPCHRTDHTPHTLGAERNECPNHCSIAHTRNTRARTTPPRRPTQALGVNTPHRHEHTNTPPRGICHCNIMPPGYRRDDTTHARSHTSERTHAKCLSVSSQHGSSAAGGDVVFWRTWKLLVPVASP